MILKRLAIVAVALLSVMLEARATKLYSINWLSDPQPCAPVMSTKFNGPIISTFYKECRFADPDLLLSMCPGQMNGQPWDANEAIVIVGYHLSTILSSADARAIVEIGTASKHGAADVFATASGKGTFTSKEWFPTGMGVPTGGDNSRIDVYASCGGQGTFAILATIFYVLPEQ